MKWIVVRLPSICAFTLTVALAATGTQTMRAQSAPGQPIVDCSNAQARIDQLNSGLPVMEDALKRSEARMDSLQNELKLGKEEAQKQETELAQEQMKEAASEVLDELVPLRARLKAFQAAGQAAGISPSASTDFIRQMNAINGQISQIEGYRRGYQQVLGKLPGRHDLWPADPGQCPQPRGAHLDAEYHADEQRVL